MTRSSFAAAFALLLTCASAFAQQTTGNITGRVTDPQGAAVPGTTVTAKNPLTGFTRSDTSDAEGIYRLGALPIGLYDVLAELQGFTTVSNKSIEVNVAQTHTLDFSLKIAAVAETINVIGAAGLIETTASSVGQVVDTRRIANLPLNGRQFANLAATVPGVGLGFHSDPTKSTQYAPLINGGAGRNVNYQIDGGDNNDDTVGGLLQQFPLEAIQEFNFITQRFKAEYGRSNGGVMNVVTKSGNNLWSGSLFELFRDTKMNAETETEHLADLASAAAGRTATGKNPYRRNQFGGSFGGPIAKDKAHFFVALERTQQDTKQIVNTGGLVPGGDGTFAVPYRETVATGKVSVAVNSSQYLSVRYGRNTNSQPYDASPVHTFDNWGDSRNILNSINVNHNWVVGGSKLNEFIFQYADYDNLIAARSSASNLTFPNGVQTGGNVNTPQTTQQKKYQFRDDFSWHVTAHGGLGHDFKTGINFVDEPRMYLTFILAKDVVVHTMLNNDANGPVQTIAISTGDSHANTPTKQYGLYIQDDWRVSDRFTVNAGLRYDLVDGLPFDQSKNANFVKLQAAGAAGLLKGIVGLENFGLTPQVDKNNFQPRIGGVYDVRGNGKDIVRGGWGIYTDFGFSNSNGLFASLDASGTSFGNVFNVTTPSGIRNPDGSFYKVGQPLSNLASQNQASGAPMQGQYVDPRLQQPYQMQSNMGWSHQFASDTVLSVDYVNSLGRDLNFKPRLNQRIPGTTIRRVSVLLPGGLSPNTSANRPALSRGESEYNALILSGGRRLSRGVDFSASYTLSKGTSNIGNASDETNTANIQDPNNPFDAPVQFGPNATTDARHRINLTAVFELPMGFRVSPFFLYRSALPIVLFDGRDLNLDGDAVDIPATAYAADTFDPKTGTFTIKAVGACTTVNCGRGWPQSQLNLRVSKSFHLGGRANVEAIGEIFNLFNAVNPSNPTTVNRTVVVPTSGAQNPQLLKPTTFSGDFQRPEQRVGQIGFRFSF